MAIVSVELLQHINRNRRWILESDRKAGWLEVSFLVRGCV